jgi:hypothetical protein
MNESSHSKDELNEPAVGYPTRNALDLPISGFESHPPKLSPTEYVAWCARTRRDLHLPEKAAQRFALKTSEEFIL